ncbi:hypothetical protein NliqN6_5289 [Naganishia liquefaciens]|uniref:DNA-directed RNA polymerase III subunit n=1 Tax=Naganishia liquefaciens TaxID=104408 RepID=A0A8H3YI62_9TREE|nr:hypothetical protein NliqN6_5289 [Naganishia liquefaciens]
MSRGGRGGGRGGFGGGLGGPGTRGGMEISTGTLTREDLQETAGNQEHGVLYPRYDRLQHPHMPTDEERRICQYTRDLLQDMRSSPYRLEDKVQKNEIENYADKYRQKTNLTTTSLDAQALGLEKSFFPERIWTAYFDPKQQIKERKVARKKKTLADIEDGDDGDNDDDDDDNDSQAGSDAEQDDYDEEEGEDDDYGNNYFDNGEADEGDDAGGGGDDEGTY